MADDKVSKSGVWFDTDKRKVVESQPENAVQLVAPGQPITADAQVVIDNWREVDAGPLETAEDLSVGVETATQKTVTTRSVAKK